jgi:alpha-galactosidase
MMTVKASELEIVLEGTCSPFEASLSTHQIEMGLDLVRLRLVAPDAAHPPMLKLGWTFPLLDVHSMWQPGSDRAKMLPPEWSCGFTSSSVSHMPVSCLHNLKGENRLAVAFSDALNTHGIKMGVHEETATISCSLSLFVEPASPICSYEAELLLDTRHLPYYQCLAGVQQWWSMQDGYQPAQVPESARLPVYSTWYSFHQKVTAIEIERECRLAKALGCETVIVDDGWQTFDNGRGYTYCGDWRVNHDKFPDMQAHVANIHTLGMKYMLWYAVPLLGRSSDAWPRFADRLLGVREDLDAGILDPRFPEVREYLIERYEQAVHEWDVDGLKLDFIDDFQLLGAKTFAEGEGRDYLSVPEAVDRLLMDIIQRLNAVKPGIMIEFRQAYVGPLMRKYGNLFRAGDCPNDMVTNRVRTLDVRLLCGSTVTHSDMLMWHPDEQVELAALQIINVIFSVPQISVLLERLPAQHTKMLSFWLSFWREHRDILLDGELKPQHPETLYPVVSAVTATKYLLALYQESIVKLDKTLPDECILLNGTHESRMFLEVKEELGVRRVQVRNCCGEELQMEDITLTNGFYLLQVPIAGIVTITSLSAS